MDIVCTLNTLGITIQNVDLACMDRDTYVIIRPKTILIPRIHTPYSPAPTVKAPEEPVEQTHASDRQRYFRELGRLGGQKTSDRKRQAARLNAHRRWRRVRENRAAALATPADSPR